jgi:hypothetical protein
MNGLRVLHFASESTLTLPDICAALEEPDGRTKEKRYKAWYKTHIYDQIGGMTPDEAYELRCTIAHQSKAIASEKRSYTRVVFTTPAGMVGVDSMVVNGALVFEVGLFCERWIKCVREWILSTEVHEHVRANLPMLLQVRPHGLPPYIVGMPIIA